jgi:hypothetical protein
MPWKRSGLLATNLFVNKPDKLISSDCYFNLKIIYLLPFGFEYFVDGRRVS